jgi:hypothetical protein
MTSYSYNPCDARVECFGMELCIKNKDVAMLNYLWNGFRGKWEEKHFSYILDKVLEEEWDEGIISIMDSDTAHSIFLALNSEDKDI